ncbi:MAG: S9 family peptidase, partial [Flavobacteriaceae bacterium]
MKRLFLLVLLVFLAACKEEKPKEFAKYTIDQFYKNTNVFGGNFSPDESKLLVSSNESGIYNVYEINIDDGAKKAVTNSDTESNYAQSYFPNDERVLYTFDKGGNENYGLYVSENGNSRTLIPGDSVRNGFFGWSKDEKSLFYNSNKRNRQFFDVYELAVSEIEKGAEASVMLYENKEGLDAGEISPNKQYIALTKVLTSADGKMYLLDRSTGDITDISVHDGDAQYSPQYFSDDNKFLYYTTDENSDFTYLARRNLESGDVEKIFEAEWDVWYAYESKNEKYRVIGINEDAKTRVRIFDLTTDKEVVLPNIEGGSISSVSISKSENLARLTVSTSASPSNIYVYNFETGDLKKLTDTL